MKRLKDNVAQKSFDVAKFYESQGQTQAAIIYYQDVVDNYPESSFVNESKARIEALKNKNVKKAAAPDKKKSQGNQQKKLSWNLFGLGKKDQKKQMQRLPPAARAKKGWRPFSFESKKEIQAVQVTPPPAETPKAEVQDQEIEVARIQSQPPVQSTQQASIEPVPLQQEEPPKVEQAIQVAESVQIAEPPEQEVKQVVQEPAPVLQEPQPVVKETPAQKIEQSPKKKSWWNP